MVVNHSSLAAFAMAVAVAKVVVVDPVAELAEEDSQQVGLDSLVAVVPVVEVGNLVVVVLEVEVGNLVAAVPVVEAGSLVAVVVEPDD
jgi:hypothetical protein